MNKLYFLTYFNFIFKIGFTLGISYRFADIKQLVSLNKGIIQNVKTYMETSIYSTIVKDCTNSNVIHQELLDKMKNISLMFQNYSEKTALTLDLPLDILNKCLFSENYDKELAPYFFTFENVFGFDNYTFEISYSIILNELIKIDPFGKISFTATFDFEWNDPRLKWHQNTSIPFWSFPKVLTVNFGKIWIPEFRVKNCQKRGCSIVPENQTKAYIMSSGNVEICFSELIESTCAVDFKNFPFDQQICILNMSFSNIDDDEDIEVELTKIDLGHSHYMADSDEWIVTSFDHNPAPVFAIELRPQSKDGKWTRIRKQIDGSNSTVILKIVAIRMTTFYATNVIVPLLIVIAIALATVIYPAGSTEKVNCLLSVILAFVFFQSLLANEIPKTHTESRLGLYVMWSMLLSAINIIFTFATIIAQRLAYTNKQLPPKTLLYFILKYNKLVGRPTSQIKGGSVNGVEPNEPELIQNVINNSSSCYNSGAVHEKDGRRKSERQWIKTMWLSFAEVLDIFFDIIFVTLNIIIFMLYMLPLLQSYFNNLAQTPYFIDL